MPKITSLSQFYSANLAKISVSLQYNVADGQRYSHIGKTSNITNYKCLTSIPLLKIVTSLKTKPPISLYHFQNFQHFKSEIGKISQHKVVWLWYEFWKSESLAMHSRGGFSSKPKIYHFLNYLTTFPYCIIYNYFKVWVIHIKGELNIKFCFASPSAFKHMN